MINNKTQLTPLNLTQEPNQNLQERFEFREIRPQETAEVTAIEHTCFPPNEACTAERMKERVKAAPELFLVAVDRQNGKIAGFLNGQATEEETLRDEFFTDASLHQPDGRNVLLLSLAVLPEYQRQGLAKEIVRRYLYREKDRGRKMILLTCLEAKISMYEKMGFADFGVSDSAWGGDEWYEMGCVLNE